MFAQHVQPNTILFVVVWQRFHHREPLAYPRPTIRRERHKNGHRAKCRDDREICHRKLIVRGVARSLQKLLQRIDRCLDRFQVLRWVGNGTAEDFTLHKRTVLNGKERELVSRGRATYHNFRIALKQTAVVEAQHVENLRARQCVGQG